MSAAAFFRAARVAQVSRDTALRAARLALAAGALALATGCALQAPRYQPSLDNVDLLKKQAPAPMAVGSFTVQAGVPAKIQLRGVTMASPVGSDYAAYLADALQQELTLAGVLDPKARVEISGVLLKSDIAAAGISTNSGEIAARIVVRNAGVQRFDKVKQASASWDSSLLGSVAIPRAAQQYPLLVQQLLTQIWTDPDFQAALK